MTKTVLVVEDNDTSRKLVRVLLELRGHRVVEAVSGEDGREQALRESPDVILMDIHLPDMSGIDALHALRADERIRDLPVIALTALAMKGDRERLLAEGFDGYLAKPIEVTTFADDVLEVLTNGRRT